MTDIDSAESRFDNAVAASRFSMPSLHLGLEEAGALNEVNSLLDQSNSRTRKSLVRALIRNIFLIEPVNREITTTKFSTRWSLPDDDPRRSEYDSCVTIWESVLSQVNEVMESNGEVIDALSANAILPYEIPLDYRERTCLPIHNDQNIAWIASDQLVETAVRLRVLLLNNEDSSLREVFDAAYAKVKVKTYLTDRVQTGDYKTNREKRWEVRPESVHFALRQDCFAIEVSLVNQMMRFEGFPQSVRDRAADDELFDNTATVARCPITMDEFRFSDFKTSLISPVHGRSDFQVGHLNPLKANAHPGESAGHVADNVAWISADGNRIQGDLSLDETRTLMLRIRRNYEEQHLV